MFNNLHRTLVCSVLFLDIEAYSTRSVTEQLALKERFNALLLEALSHVATNDRIVLDTGDGAAISFLSAPEDALFAAMNLRDAITASNSDQTLPLHVRIGIHLGPVRLIKDINGQVNIVGDGINDAQRIMSFAEPGKILASRSYYEVVSRLSGDYAKLFVYDGTRTDKHVREHSVYTIGAPESLHRNIDSPPSAEPAATPAPSGMPATTAPAPEAPGQGRMLAFIVVAILLAGAGIGALLLSGRDTAQETPPKAAEHIAEKAPESSRKPEPPRKQEPAAEISPEQKKTQEPVAEKSSTQKPASHKEVPTQPRDSAKEKTEPTDHANVRTKTAAPPDWLVEMRKELAACPQLIVLSLACKEKIRWKYCQPSHWDKFEECTINRNEKP